MKSSNKQPWLVTSRPARLALAAAVLAATGALTVTFVSSGGKGTAEAATELNQYTPIQNVRPNVRNVAPGAQASTGVFTVDCGTNGNGKFSPDNPVAQPGIKNGAEQVLVLLAGRAHRQDGPVRGRHATGPQDDDPDGDLPRRA